MTSNKFSKDDIIAFECGKFADEYFFRKSRQKDHFKRIPYDNSIENRKLQKEYGVDLYIESDGLSCFIDEKAKVNGYVNKAPLRNSVEIMSHDKEGWFIDPKKKTNKYAFICISCDSSVTTEYDILSSNITDMLYIIVDKEELKEYLLKENGLSISKLIEDARMKLNYNKPCIYIHEGHFLTCKKEWSSRPVNFAFNMEECLNLSKTIIIHITRDGFKKISKKEVISIWKNCK